ncbi:unnamed protein product [Musa acuminata subsp. malaccensis]|uniref:(wild Malaysian banana) hypothetical protein n=1 Tax=Musa acuminata subsp. malaccensis TaxID=214687 RepID=A0A804K356_MUSAM|nr:unnamed protein product [Musa acuminata subsp. malaccensis]
MFFFILVLFPIFLDMCTSFNLTHSTPQFLGCYSHTQPLKFLEFV